MKGVLDRLCDAAYRREHPERARVLGGHRVEDRGRRLADALVSLCRGESAGGGGVPAVVVVVDAVTLESTLLPDTPLCVVPGCRVPAQQCELHHVVEFEDGGPAM